MDESTQHFAVEGAGTTVVHPLGLLMLVVCGGLFLVLPRKFALWPLLILVCFVSARQCVAIFGLNLYFMRIIVLFFGPVRMLMHNEFRNLRLNLLDVLVIAYGACFLLTGALNWGFSLDVIKFRSGLIVEIVGLYLLFCALIRTPDDVRSIIRCLAIISIPLAGFFSVEQFTGRNLFSIFGGVTSVTYVREGRLRSQGAFGNPILAGTIWASFLPFFIYGILAQKRQRAVMMIGSLATCGIVVLCASATPVLGALTALLGMMLFPLRRYTRYAFGASAIMLVVLHFVMTAPVWHLIARINITGGNSAWHRFVLVDGFITHWNEWWFLGSKVGTEHWGHFAFDTANQFVSAGISGGIVTLALFIAIIVQGLLATGRIRKSEPLLGWSIGVSIFVHCVCFFGISIWGQLHFAWALPLAMAGSLATYKPPPVAQKLPRLRTVLTHT